MEEIVQETNNLEKPKEDKQFVVGVAILRFFMCFMIVSTHYGGQALFKLGGMFYVFQEFHVPVFMLMSFLLCGHYFLEPSGIKCKNRILRMVIPFAFWGIVSYLLSLIMWPNLPLYLLGWQLLTVSHINVSLWFLSMMIWISGLFWLIRYLSNKKVFLIVVSIFSIICLVLQYTGLNVWLFNQTIFEIRVSVGRIVEMIPYATAGVWLSLTIPHLYKVNFKIKIIIFVSTLAVMGAALIIRNQFISYRTPGDDYAGLFKLSMAALLVLTAYTNPLNAINSSDFKATIKWITAFTMGVFCMHDVIGRFVEWGFGALGWPIKNVLAVLAIYAICYLISFLINLIPNKYVKQLVA